MHTANLILILVAMTVAAYYLAHSRSMALAKPLGGIRHLHSLPFYYGLRAAIWCGVPALLLLACWLIFDEPIIAGAVLASLPEHLQPTTVSQENLILGTVRNLATGSLSADSVDPALAAASERLVALREMGGRIISAGVLGLALLGGFVAWITMSPLLRARQ